jgi:hypothetical protein
MMTRPPQLYSRQRAPRVKLSGSILAMLGLANGQHVRGALHQLSATGGLLQLTEPLENSAPVEILFHLGSATVRARAAMLFPIWATQGCLQPFRFTEMADEVRRQLESDIKRLLHGQMSVNEASGAGEIREPQPAPQPAEVAPTEVTLYFETPEDAFRFTVAISSVISDETRASVREDFAKLARAIGSVSRVTTQGVLNAQGRQANSLTAAS